MRRRCNNRNAMHNAQFIMHSDIIKLPGGSCSLSAFSIPEEFFQLLIREQLLFAKAEGMFGNDLKIAV